MLLLDNKAIGDIVKIKENGEAVNYIIVHKGLPSSMYDSSCDGVWVLREEASEQRVWNTVKENDYANSDINRILNDTYYNAIESSIRNQIKLVKIPYRPGAGTSHEVNTGADGLPCKIFLLSGYEVGITEDQSIYYFVDGAKLAYFDLQDNNTRICNLNGTPTNWWLRMPSGNSINQAVVILADGTGNPRYGITTPEGIRPAFVLPSNLSVNSDGFVTTNSSPTITSDKTGNLGTLVEGFDCNYSVTDVDAADNVTVTLTMDDTMVKSFTATKGQQYTYSLTGNDWLKITNGSHTFKIIATDGIETTENTATFTRACNKLSTTLSAALPANDIIKTCTLKIIGAIPDDAVCVYEVTNNGNDASPVWEDCTDRVKNGSNHVFNNKTAENGFAFNFRITIHRGLSNAGGYIIKVSGGFA